MPVGEIIPGGTDPVVNGRISYVDLLDYYADPNPARNRFRKISTSRVHQLIMPRPVAARPARRVYRAKGRLAPVRGGSPRAAFPGPRTAGRPAARPVGPVGQVRGPPSD